MSAFEIPAKAHMVGFIQDLPDDATYDEILRELAFHRMVLRGLNDVDESHLISTAELRRRVKSWQS